MHVNRTIDLAALLAKRSHFLFGPRQTGKTTLVRDQLRGVRLIDLLESETCLALQLAPQRLREWCPEPGAVVVIDKIQRQPGLLDEVHLGIESRKQRAGGEDVDVRERVAEGSSRTPDNGHVAAVCLGAW